VISILNEINHANNQFLETFNVEHMWPINTVPEGFWEGNEWIHDEKKSMEYLKWLRSKLNIRSMEDWYNVKRDDVESLYGQFLLDECGGLFPMLKKFYPSK
jgi:hypothetical protein